MSVVAEHGWQAEVLAKAALLAGLERAPAVLRANAATGLTVDWRGRIHLTPGIEEHLTVPAHQVAAISLKDRALSGVRISVPALAPPS